MMDVCQSIADSIREIAIANARSQFGADARKAEAESLRTLVEAAIRSLLADELGYEPSETTVKEHSEYRGQAQTVIQRIAVLED